MIKLLVRLFVRKLYVRNIFPPKRLVVYLKNVELYKATFEYFSISFIGNSSF